MDRVEWTIQLTRAAFHAGLLVDKVCKLASHLESTVRANVHADTASGAKRGIILESIGLICIEHVDLLLVYEENPNVKKQSSPEHPGHRWYISEHFLAHTGTRGECG